MTQTIWTTNEIFQIGSDVIFVETLEQFRHIDGRIDIGLDKAQGGRVLHVTHPFGEGVSYPIGILHQPGVDASSLHDTGGAGADLALLAPSDGHHDPGLSNVRRYVHFDHDDPLSQMIIEELGNTLDVSRVKNFGQFCHDEAAHAILPLGPFGCLASTRTCLGNFIATRAFPSMGFSFVSHKQSRLGSGKVSDPSWNNKGMQAKRLQAQNQCTN
mmetsp:Transcript_27262/g.63319  ORF Transcript_27262/g.63319 Transcript_27262/m.63319 type:complete len:214 (-) Transcript_27262:137-778(-)